MRNEDTGGMRAPPPLPLPVNDSLRKATILLLHIQIESTQAALPTGQRAPDNGSKEAFSRINLVYKDSIMRRQAAGFIRLDPSVSFRCLSVKSVRKKKRKEYMVLPPLLPPPPLLPSSYLVSPPPAASLSLSPSVHCGDTGLGTVKTPRLILMLMKRSAGAGPREGSSRESHGQPEPPRRGHPCKGWFMRPLSKAAGRR